MTIAEQRVARKGEKMIISVTLIGLNGKPYRAVILDREAVLHQTTVSRSGRWTWFDRLLARVPALWQLR